MGVGSDTVFVGLVAAGRGEGEPGPRLIPRPAPLFCDPRAAESPHGSVTKFGSVLLGTPVAVPALGWSLARPGALKGGENPQLPMEAPDGRPRGAEEGFWA